MQNVLDCSSGMQVSSDLYCLLKLIQSAEGFEPQVKVAHIREIIINGKYDEASVEMCNDEFFSQIER